MAVVAVICEYNLFHNGHERLIRAIREKFGGDCTVLSLMSGAFTQRGDFAAADKYLRAKAALLCGSDITLEFPLPFCASVGEVFAGGAVNILNSLGGIDALVFGSECGDMALIRKIAENQLDSRFEERIKTELEKSDGGESYIALRERVYNELFGKRTLKPNDTLAIEYTMALMSTNSKIKPYTVKREGSESATEARKLFLSGDLDSLSGLVPPAAFELYKTADKYSEKYASRAVLYALRNMRADEGRTSFGAGGGLAERIIEHSKKVSSLDALYSCCTTKKYTLARIKRCVLSMLLGITKEDVNKTPDKLLLLSANEKGRAFAANVRKKDDISIVTRPALTYGEIAERADRLYSLSGENAEKCGKILTQNPYIEK